MQPEKRGKGDEDPDEDSPRDALGAVRDPAHPMAHILHSPPPATLGPEEVRNNARPSSFYPAPEYHRAPFPCSPDRFGRDLVPSFASTNAVHIRNVALGLQRCADAMEMFDVHQINIHLKTVKIWLPIDEL